MAGICLALGAIATGVIFAAAQLNRIADELEKIEFDLDFNNKWKEEEDEA